MLSRIKNGYRQFYDLLFRRWIFVHRRVAEESHGRISPGCEVHHIDHNKFNNSPQNLVVLKKIDHIELHRRDWVSKIECRTVANVKSLLPAHIKLDDDAIQRAGVSTQMRINPPFCAAGPVTSGFLSDPELLRGHYRLHRKLTILRRLEGLLSREGKNPRPTLNYGGCPRCGGSGYLPEYSHVEGGVCFLCGGGEPTSEREEYRPYSNEPDDLDYFDDWDD